MRVIFAGGGTGGHLYPAVSLAEELRHKNVECHFLVSDRGIDARILTRLGYPYTEQKVAPFMGKSLGGKAKALAKLAAAVFKTFPLIKKGDKVILTGGFAAAPAAAVAKMKGCDLYLHEQNSVMGLVNRVFAGMSKKVFLSYPDTKKARGVTIVTGNPVRRVFKRIEDKKEFTGNILVMGGSQGSRTINKLIAGAAEGLIKAGFKITHQTGEGLYRETLEEYGQEALMKYHNKLFVRPYIDGVAAIMGETDIVVARSGSGSVFEIKAAGRPALYIPLASASDNHQYYNALWAVNTGGALMMEEKEASPELLLKKLTEIKNDIDTFKENLRKNPLPDSCGIILREAGIE